MIAAIKRFFCKPEPERERCNHKLDIEQLLAFVERKAKRWEAENNKAVRISGGCNSGECYVAITIQEGRIPCYDPDAK